MKKSDEVLDTPEDAAPEDPKDPAREPAVEEVEVKLEVEADEAEEDEEADPLDEARSEAEMEHFCRALPALPKMANLVEDGDTPTLPPARLEEIGFKIAAYPLTRLNTATRAMNEALAAIRQGVSPQGLLEFSELREIVGFDAYDAAIERFRKRRS